jgi:hypothetical protein
MASNDSTASRDASTLEAPSLPLREAIHSSAVETIEAVVSDPALNEDLALALLQRNDLPPKVLEQLSKNGGVAIMKSRKLKLALAQHPKTPRHVSLPLLRHLFTFDLMQVSLAPVAPAGIKKAAEEALLSRLEAISLGEKVSLARRASARVAGALLLDSEPRVIQAALENSHLTEASVIKALVHRNASAAFVHAVCRHSKWSPRREVRIALLRNKNTPLARALEFARALPLPLVREVLQASSLPGNIKSHLLKETST